MSAFVFHLYNDSYNGDLTGTCRHDCASIPAAKAMAKRFASKCALDVDVAHDDDRPWNERYIATASNISGLVVLQRLDG